MANLRVEKVKSDLERAISSAIFEIDKFVTVGEVLLSPDLRNAKVGVSSILKGVCEEEVVQKLNEKLYLINKHVGKKVSLKYFPKIMFVTDRHKARITKAQAILDSVE